MVRYGVARKNYVLKSTIHRHNCFDYRWIPSAPLCFKEFSSFLKKYWTPWLASPSALTRIRETARKVQYQWCKQQYQYGFLWYTWCSLVSETSCSLFLTIVRAPPLLYYILNADAKKRRERVHVNFFSRSIVYERPQSHEPGRLSHISTAPRDEGFPDASKGRDHLLAAFALLFALATGSGRGPHGRRQRGARDAGAAGHAGPNGRLLSSWTSSRDPCVLAPSGDSKALHANPSAPTSTSGLCAACRQAVWCPQLLCSDAVWGGFEGATFEALDVRRPPALTSGLCATWPSCSAVSTVPWTCSVPQRPVTGYGRGGRRVGDWHCKLFASIHDPSTPPRLWSCMLVRIQSSNHRSLAAARLSWFFYQIWEKQKNWVWIIGNSVHGE
jgi:hypothetical protein